MARSSANDSADSMPDSIRFASWLLETLASGAASDILSPSVFAESESWLSVDDDEEDEGWMVVATVTASAQHLTRMEQTF